MSSGDNRRTLLFLRKGDQILLAMKKRGFGAGRWNGVGGKLDPGETLEEALVRECQEEIEVTPNSWTFVAEHDFRGESGGEPWSMYVYAYICEDWQGEPVETEEMSPKWFKIDEIPYDDMWKDDPFWIPQVLEGKKVFGTYVFDENDNMLSHDVQEVDVLPLEKDIHG